MWFRRTSRAAQRQELLTSLPNLAWVYFRNYQFKSHVDQKRPATDDFGDPMKKKKVFTPSNAEEIDYSVVFSTSLLTTIQLETGASLSIVGKYVWVSVKWASIANTNWEWGALLRDYLLHIRWDHQKSRREGECHFERSREMSRTLQEARSMMHRKLATP